jgi:hypothetical protein
LINTVLYGLYILFIISSDISQPAEKIGGDNKIKNSGPEYFSGNEKVILTYKSDFGETKSWIVKEKGSLKFYNQSDDFKYQQKLLINDKGVFVEEVYQKISIFLFVKKEGRYTYSKPMLRVPFPIVENAQWKWSGEEFCDGDTSTISLTGKIVGMDTVLTEAGKFEALKIETIIETSDETKNIITEWFAVGIGMVKMHLSIEGGGFLAFVGNIFGYGDIDFELKKITPN